MNNNLKKIFKHYEETHKKMSEARKGKKRNPFTDEHLKKMSKSKNGKHWKIVDGKRVWY